MTPRVPFTGTLAAVTPPAGSRRRRTGRHDLRLLPVGRVVPWDGALLPSASALGHDVYGPQARMKGLCVWVHSPHSLFAAAAALLH